MACLSEYNAFVLTRAHDELDLYNSIYYCIHQLARNDEKVRGIRLYGEQDNRPAQEICNHWECNKRTTTSMEPIVVLRSQTISDL